MLSEAAFVELARAKYAQIAELEKETSFYVYEKTFDAIWVDLGRQVLEGSISQVPKSVQKKSSSKADTGKLP
jgi:hypothetical protein